MFVGATKCFWSLTSCIELACAWGMKGSGTAQRFLSNPCAVIFASSASMPGLRERVWVSALSISDELYVLLGGEKGGKASGFGLVKNHNRQGSRLLVDTELYVNLGREVIMCMAFDESVICDRYMRWLMLMMSLEVMDDGC